MEPLAGHTIDRQSSNLRATLHLIEQRSYLILGIPAVIAKGP